MNPLGPGEVHVWWFNLDVPERLLATLLPLLTPAERLRAESFLNPAARRRFIVRRAKCRRVLARYCSVTAQSLRVETTPAGKPFLPDHPLHFNLSSSGNIAALAVSRHPVGIDLETGDPSKLLAAKRYMPSAPPDADLIAAWSRSEAFLKLTGSGLSRPLNSFDIIPDGADGFGVISEGAPSAVGRTIRMSRGALSIAVAREPLNLRCFNRPAEPRR